jgi:hypothetical protein
MVRGNSTVVEHSATDREIKGSDPANHHFTPGENGAASFIGLEGPGQ